MKRLACLLLIFGVIAVSGHCLALERGAILYHTGDHGNMYGKTPDPADPALELPCSLYDAIVLREIGSGHVALYIGNERIIHAVGRGVVEEGSEYFIPKDDLSEEYQYLGAKIPVNYNTWTETEKDQLILKAKEQVGADYDIQFRHQKGPYNDGFTCVGLVEYVYEQVGYNITPSGYYPESGTGKSKVQTYNCLSTSYFDWNGTNTFAEQVEFSRFEHPLVEILHGDVGMVHNDDRYIFFPYTQYIQITTEATVTDVPVSGGEASDDDNWWECFVATAAYGSSLHPHITVFREVRDRYLRESSVGRMFLTAYYRYSPPVARFIADHSALRIAVRIGLVPLLGISYMTVTFGPGMTVALLTLLLMLPLSFVYCYRKKRMDQ
jgi:hypothetical protein